MIFVAGIELDFVKFYNRVEITGVWLGNTDITDTGRSSVKYLAFDAFEYHRRVFSKEQNKAFDLTIKDLRKCRHISGYRIPTTVWLKYRMNGVCQYDADRHMLSNIVIEPLERVHSRGSISKEPSWYSAVNEELYLLSSKYNEGAGIPIRGVASSETNYIFHEDKYGVMRGKRLPRERFNSENTMLFIDSLTGLPIEVLEYGGDFYIIPVYMARTEESSLLVPLELAGRTKVKVAHFGMEHGEITDSEPLFGIVSTEELSYYLFNNIAFPSSNNREFMHESDLRFDRLAYHNEQYARDGRKELLLINGTMDLSVMRKPIQKDTRRGGKSRKENNDVTSSRNKRRYNSSL